MKENYDSRYITDDFLEKHFPPKNRFNTLMKEGANHKIYLEECLQTYQKYKNKLNQKRTKSGKSTYSDKDISEWVLESDGTVELSKII